MFVFIYYKCLTQYMLINPKKVPEGLLKTIQTEIEEPESKLDVLKNIFF